MKNPPYPDYPAPVHGVSGMVPEPDGRVDALVKALRWYIENDETNEGDTPLPDHRGRTWNEINVEWLAGKKRAIQALEAFGETV